MASLGTQILLLDLFQNDHTYIYLYLTKKKSEEWLIKLIFEPWILGGGEGGGGGKIREEAERGSEERE